MYLCVVKLYNDLCVQLRLGSAVQSNAVHRVHFNTMMYLLLLLSLLILLLFILHHASASTSDVAHAGKQVVQ